MLSQKKVKLANYLCDFATLSFTGSSVQNSTVETAKGRNFDFVDKKTLHLRLLQAALIRNPVLSQKKVIPQ